MINNKSSENPKVKLMKKIQFEKKVDDVEEQPEVKISGSIIPDSFGNYSINKNKKSVAIQTDDIKFLTKIKTKFTKNNCKNLFKCCFKINKKTQINNKK